MDNTSTNYDLFVELGVRLTELAVKGTASAVNKKIRAIKEERNVEKLRTTYDELINEVLQEREEAVRIAQTYKAEIDRIVISDEDIEHLYNTVARIIEIIKAVQIASALSKGVEEIDKVKKQAESYEQLKELVNADTLKTMQLLGFNYKAAIGEPLTKICADAITSWGSSKNDKQTCKKRK